MKSIVVFFALAGSAWLAFAQGSGSPSPVGQSDTAQAASAAERSVEARHEKVVQASKARAAKHAAKKASAANP